MKYKDTVDELKKNIKKLYNKEYEAYDSSKGKYRDRTDNLIRGIVVDFVDQFMDEVSEIQAIALQSQMIMIWSDLDRLMNHLKDLKFQLSEGTNYHGSTFFISSKKSVEHFQILAESELAILDVNQELKIRIKKYKEAIDSALLSDSSQLIGEIIKLLNRIIGLWTIRADTITEYRFIN